MIVRDWLNIPEMQVCWTHTVQKTLTTGAEARFLLIYADQTRSAGPITAATPGEEPQKDDERELCGTCSSPDGRYAIVSLVSIYYIGFRVCKKKGVSLF